MENFIFPIFLILFAAFTCWLGTGGETKGKAGNSTGVGGFTGGGP